MHPVSSLRRGARRAVLVLVLAAVAAPPGPGGAAAAADAGTAAAAAESERFLLELAARGAEVVVYDEPGGGRFVPSGWQGDFAVPPSPGAPARVDEGWRANPRTGQTCLRLHYGPDNSPWRESARVAFLPRDLAVDRDWGSQAVAPASVGRGAVLRFAVRADLPPDAREGQRFEVVVAGVSGLRGDSTGRPIVLPRPSDPPCVAGRAWTECRLDLAGHDLTRLVRGVEIGLRRADALSPAGITLYLDDVRFEQADDALRLPPSFLADEADRGECPVALAAGDTLPLFGADGGPAVADGCHPLEGPRPRAFRFSGVMGSPAGRQRLTVTARRDRATLTYAPPPAGAAPTWAGVVLQSLPVQWGATPHGYRIDFDAPPRDAALGLRVSGQGCGAGATLRVGALAGACGDSFLSTPAETRLDFPADAPDSRTLRVPLRLLPGGVLRSGLLISLDDAALWPAGTAGPCRITVEDVRLEGLGGVRVTEVGDPRAAYRHRASHTYDVAVAIIALAGREGAAARATARRLAETLLYCQDHDPDGGDGRLRNAYVAHPLVDADGHCRPFPELYGAGIRVGNLAWAALALLHARATAPDDPVFQARCLAGARRLADWILAYAWNPGPLAGFTGGRCGPTAPDGLRGERYCWLSTEHNADVVALGVALQQLTGDDRYGAAAAHAWRFVRAALAPDEPRFHTGTSAAAPGERTWNREQRPLDPTTFVAFLPFPLRPAGDPLALGVDRGALLAWGDQHCRPELPWPAGAGVFPGAAPAEAPRAYHYRCGAPGDRDAWPEGHAQAVVAWRQAGDDARAAARLRQLDAIVGAWRAEEAARPAPSPATPACAPDVAARPPRGPAGVPCSWPGDLLTGFSTRGSRDRYYRRAGLGPAAWHLLAHAGRSPFHVPGTEPLAGPPPGPAAAPPPGPAPLRSSLAPLDGAQPWVALANAAARGAWTRVRVGGRRAETLLYLDDAGPYELLEVELAAGVRLETGLTGGLTAVEPFLRLGLTDDLGATPCRARADGPRACDPPLDFVNHLALSGGLDLHVLDGRYLGAALPPGLVEDASLRAFVHATQLWYLADVPTWVSAHRPQWDARAGVAGWLALRWPDLRQTVAAFVGQAGGALTWARTDLLTQRVSDFVLAEATLRGGGALRPWHPLDLRVQAELGWVRDLRGALGDAPGHDALYLNRLTWGVRGDLRWRSCHRVADGLLLSWELAAFGRWRQAQPLPAGRWVADPVAHRDWELGLHAGAELRSAQGGYDPCRL
jgi:hypothetical protein